jgi:hypothetical protein
MDQGQNQQVIASAYTEQGSMNGAKSHMCTKGCHEYGLAFGILVIVGLIVIIIQQSKMLCCMHKKNK